MKSEERKMLSEGNNNDTILAVKIVLQRVSRAQVTVDGAVVGSINRGYVLLFGAIDGDAEEQAAWLAEKISKLRLFEGKDGKMNDRSILDINGDVLVISQFTLAGSTKKGSRPDYTAALAPKKAKELYEYFTDQCTKLGIKRVETGQFGAHMHVELVNDGPVTLCLEK